MKKIAIIGGGFTGLLCAWLLENQGYQTTIFEKTQRLGGHCYSINTHQGVFELGCVFTTSGHFQKLLDQLEIPYEMEYLHRNFINEQGEKINQLQPTAINDFLNRYHELPDILAPYQQYMNSPDYQHEHPDLYLPFGEWCASKQLTVLLDMYAPHFSAFGFGDLQKVPAMYVLKHLDLPTIQGLVEGRKIITFPKGISRVIDNLANQLKDIRYGETVLSIDVSNHKLETTSGSHAYDALIVTTLLPANCYQNKTYQELFAEMLAEKFVCLIVNAQTHRIKNAYLPGNFNQPDKIQLLHAFTPNQPRTHYSLYCYSEQPINKLYATVKGTLNALEIKDYHLVAYQAWQTFPHVDSSMLVQGFYQRLFELQGQHNIYFTGGLTTFPNLDKLTIQVRHLINNYFINGKC